MMDLGLNTVIPVIIQLFTSSIVLIFVVIIVYSIFC